MPEIYRIGENGERNYVGYMNSRGEIVDTRRGGLEGSRRTAGLRGGNRNAATRVTQRRFRATGGNRTLG